MADFCSNCSEYTGGYDIDPFKIALKLKRGKQKPIFCEGCYIRGIRKDQDGNLFLIKLEAGEFLEEATTQEALIFIEE
jgi:hypothetical protein